MSVHRKTLRAKDDLRRMSQRILREQGWNDGYAQRPARSLNLVYQQAWKRGAAEQRRADDEMGAA